MDRKEISNLHSGPSIDVSYQVSVHLIKQFQRRRFLEINQSETRIACLWQPCLLTDSDFHILIFFSGTAQPKELKLGMGHLWKVFYKDCSFHPDPLTNMAATGNSCF
jgi:hypothetical protein